VRRTNGNRQEEGDKQRMTKAKDTTRPSGPADAHRDRIIQRAKKYNADLLERFRIASTDLENNNHLAALGALDGIDSKLQEFRMLLRLIE